MKKCGLLCLFLLMGMMGPKLFGQCNFNVSNSTPCVGEVVSFDVLAPSGDYSWDFDSDQVPDAFGNTVNYIFPDAGNAITSVPVTLYEDGDSCHTEILNLLPVPDASIGVVPGSGILDGNEIRVCSGSPDVTLSIFNASATYSSNTDYEIDWGDGNIENFTNASFSNASFIDHDYHQFGYFSIMVSATNIHGCVDTSSYTFYNGSNPSVGLANPGNTVGSCAPVSISFPITNTSLNADGTQYLVFVADSLVASYTQADVPSNFTYVFTESSCNVNTSTGNYGNAFDVRIVANNPCGSSQATIEPIEISTPPNAEFVIDEPVSPCVNQVFTFTNSSTGINEIISGFPSTCETSLSPSWLISPGIPGVDWNLLAGNLFSSEEVEIEFLTPGVYTIAITVVSDACGPDTYQQNVTILEPPNADAELSLNSNNSGIADECISTHASLVNQATGEDITTSWNITPATGWSFLNGTDLNTSNLDLEFDTEGTYQISLAASNICATDIWDTTLVLATLPDISLQPIPDYCENALLDFDPSNVMYEANGGSFSAFSWSFPGASPASSSDQYPTNISYNSPGNYIVELTATNQCGSTTLRDTFTVQAPGTITLEADKVFCRNASPISLTAIPSGGNWSGPGVDASGNFSPQNANLGSNILHYTYQDNNCLLINSMQITILDLPNVDAGPDEAVCVDGSAFILAGATPGGGSWTVDNNGIILGGNVFDPTASGPGVYTLSYSYTDGNGCTNIDNKSIVVHDLPNVEAGADQSICENPNDIPLSGFNPAGGTWTGTGVSSNGIFNVSNTPGLGAYKLYYNYTDPSTNCSNTDSLIITVVPNEVADAGEDEIVCQNDNPFVLNTGSPAGGSWSGPGVLPGNIFDPYLAGPGTHTLSYSYGLGYCETVDTKIITVQELPMVAVPADQIVCIDRELVDLSSATPSGGVWSGPGITGSDFDASIAGAGVHQLTYSYTDPVSSCSNSESMEIEVKLLPELELNDTVLCNQAGLVDLPYASPPGGNWTGPGVSNNRFDPSTAGGAGSYTVYYAFVDGFNCASFDSITVTVIEASQIDAGPDLSFCISHPIIDLDAMVSPAGGRWELETGTGLNDNFFDPAQAGAGTFTLRYILGEGNCQVSDELDITIHPLPLVDAGADLEICFGEAAFELSNFSPAGGVWSGTGIVDPSLGLLDPSTLVTGRYMLYYSINDENSCENRDSLTLTVKALPEIDAGRDTSFCHADILEWLAPAHPVGGTWSGPGIIDDQGGFNPQLAGGVGSYILSYSYVDQNSTCSNSDSITIEVFEPVDIDAGRDDTLCIDQGIYQLNPVTPLNGSWSGPGIVDPENGQFDPMEAGAGFHTLIYTYGTGSCQVKDELMLLVIDLSWMTSGEDESICVNAENIVLSGQNPSYGIWSGPGIIDPLNAIFDPSDAGPGEHILTYTHTDPLSGCVAFDEKLIEVFPMEAPAFEIPEIACIGDSINFDNQSNILYTAYWDFGDGHSSDEFNPRHAYTDPNTYSILLTVDNEFGCRDSIRHNIFITERPNAHFVPDTTEACVGIELHLENQSFGHDISFNWDFGNGQIDTEEHPNLIYFSQGINDTSYVITLETSNLCGSDWHSDTIIIHPIPVMEFGISPESDCSPVTYSFANVSTGSPETYFWDLGNGNTSTDSIPDPQIYFTDSLVSEYSISLIGTNVCGADTAELSFLVEPVDVTAFFDASVLQGCQPLTVQFSNFATQEALIEWDFGDGNSSVEMDPAHTFEEVGQYKVIQYAISECGYDSTFVTITVLPKPEVEFNHETYVCQGEPIKFTNLSINTVGHYWDFGDGDSSELNSPVHVFDGPGTYQVSLTGISEFNQCPATYTSEVVVRPLPTAAFEPSAFNGCAPLELNFENLSENASFFSWDFGDGNSSIDDSPSHLFQEEGSYEIKLLATDEHGCSNDSTILNITAFQSPTADFRFDRESLCGLPAEIDFVNNSKNADAYQWEFGDGNSSNFNNPSHSFSTSNTFEIQLIAQNQFGCADTIMESLTTYPKPEALFDIDQVEGCAPVAVSFSNLSTNAEQFYWNFGDGYVSELEEEIHVYEKRGSYSVLLVASVGGVCFDTLYKRGLVEVFPNPTASFVVVEKEQTENTGEYEFINQSTLADQYFWEFSDGFSTTEESPSHQFLTNGARQIYLEASNIYGCVDDTLITLVPNFIKGLYLPNGFSPEQGIGEVRLFKPKGIGLKEYHIQVFSPYGQLLWESTELEGGQPAEAWDGTHKGKLLPQDVYVWKCFARFEDGTVWTGQKDSKGRFKTLGSLILLR